MKIAIFGGAFDPPHFGHQKVVTNFLKLNLVDELWLLPVKNHAFAKTMASAKDRLAMLGLLKENYFSKLPVRICEYELEQTGTSITFKTLEALSEKYPQHQFSFLMGSDNLASFHKWHSFEELLRLYRFFIYPRSGYDFSLLRSGMIPLHDLEEMKVSSTEVKACLQNGADPNDLVPLEIVHYFRQHRLYFD